MDLSTAHTAPASPSTATIADLRTDGTRLWQSLMDLAQLGATVKGGVCRLALTDLDRQARDLFVQWCEAAGCSVSVDAIGNIFARRPGRNPALPPVMTGSHIDTQPTGGKFDGCFGVLAFIGLRTYMGHDTRQQLAAYNNVVQMPERTAHITITLP